MDFVLIFGSCFPSVTQVLYSLTKSNFSNIYSNIDVFDIRMDALTPCMTLLGAVAKRN
jgi:hypothetical protein